MNDGFAFFDIIIFAMLAGYLVFQLRRALGRRSDNQEPKSKPNPNPEQRAEHTETNNVVAIKPNAVDVTSKIKVIPNPSMFETAIITSISVRIKTKNMKKKLRIIDFCISF